MNTLRLSMAIALVALASSSYGAATQLAQADPSTTATKSSMQATTASQTQGPKTREQVKQELAQAIASGDYQRMLLWYDNPAPTDPKLRWPHN